MCEEKLMCLTRNYGASDEELITLFQTLCTARSEIQSICCKYDLHASMSMGMIKSRIALFYRGFAVR